jgi:membrane associated rhomboid family serine protease
MDRWLMFNFLTVATLALVVLSIVTVASSMTDREAVYAMLYAAWNGGIGGFVLGLHYAIKRRRKTKTVKNSKTLGGGG